MIVFVLLSISDYDFTGCLKSISGCVPTLVNRAMQAISIACYEVTIQVVWLKNFISGFQVVKSISEPNKDIL